MSDPVSNAEIEDVLSSIRRLVSDEPSSGDARRKPSEDAETERFVLTPAFRVAEDEDLQGNENGAAAGSGGGLEMQSGPGGADEAPIEIDVVDEGQDADQTSGAEIAQFPNRQPENLADFQNDDDWSEHDEQQAGQEVDSDFDHEPQFKATPAKEWLKPLADLSLEERIAELEAAIEQAPQEWEPDGSEDGTSDETRPIGHFSASPAEQDDETDPSPAGQADDALFGPAKTGKAPAVGRPVTPEAPMPAEDLTSEDHDDGVKSDSAFDAEADETEWSHQDDMTMSPEGSGPSETSEDVEEGGNFLADDEAMMDEEALREMVGDLVREELQGVLGERITRNVRRLVRREIQRAMAMRDLE